MANCAIYHVLKITFHQAEQIPRHFADRLLHCTELVPVHAGRVAGKNTQAID
jgi:hypothetical protein